jgi:hypothetical protein
MVGTDIYVADKNISKLFVVIICVVSREILNAGYFLDVTSLQYNYVTVIILYLNLFVRAYFSYDIKY